MPSAPRACAQRTQKAWGHTAHRGWARLLLGRIWGIIIHGRAHRSINDAAMPTDEDDQFDDFAALARAASAATAA